MQLPAREPIATVGILALAVGLADREAFYTMLGAAGVLLGVALLALAAVAKEGRAFRQLAYPALFVTLSVIAALAPFYPGQFDLLAPVLTLSAPVAFYALGARPGLRVYRLPLVAALIVAAHAAYMTTVGVPQHEDVYKFLNSGVDALVRGVNPYGTIPASLDGPWKFTYPPGVLLLVAPFRLLFGDVRWSYILGELIAVLLMARVVRRRMPQALERWQEALLLIPLVLPRASQAFFVFTNHEWLLVALAVIALFLAADGAWVATGIVLGIGIATKQYFIVFPVVFLLPVVRPRSIALGLGVAFLITLPFLLWDFKAFIVDVFGNLGNAPDPTRVTIWAVLTNLGASPGVVGARVLAVIGLAAVVLLWLKSRRDLSTSLRACGLALLLFVLTSTFAAYNYYVYALVFYTWGLVIPAARERPGHSVVTEAPASAP